MAENDNGNGSRWQDGERGKGFFEGMADRFINRKADEFVHRNDPPQPTPPAPAQPLPRRTPPPRPMK